MTTRIAASALFLAAMLVLPSMASAELTGACLTDAKAMCPGVQPGGGKIRDCLKSAHQGPVRSLQGCAAQGRKRQGLCE